MSEKLCRCGAPEALKDGEHPCHGGAYTCRKPAYLRLSATYPPVALTGYQMKVEATETWACEECWETWKAILKVKLEALSRPRQ
jgi:hypothetical protein